MCIAGMIIIIPAYLVLFIIDGNKVLNPGTWTMVFVFSIVYAVYFNKDIFAGRSIGKRALKYQVVNNKTGLVASPYKCLVRNLTTILWPIEVIAALINPSRKIGDFIAGTKIQATEVPQERETSKSELVFCFLIAYLLALSITVPFHYYTITK